MLENLGDALQEAFEAMVKALTALLLFALTVLCRILQALFTLARPALLVGCVVLVGFGSVRLFVSTFAAFGGDAPAALVAVLSIIVVPAALVVLAGDYGIWAVLAASGVLSWLVALAIARSPPALLSMSIPLVIGAVFAYFAFSKESDGETMNKRGLGDILLLLVNGGAVIYSAARSWHVITQSLPPEMMVFGVVALSVTETALCGWEIYYLTSAKCGMQKGIALIMFLAQLVCVGALVAGDTWMVTDPTNAPQYIKMAVLWSVPAILVANIGALFAVHAADPDAQLEQAKRDVRQAIHTQTVSQLREGAAKIAAQVSGRGADHYADETMAEYLRSFSGDGNGKVTMAEDGAPAPKVKRRRG